MNINKISNYFNSVNLIILLNVIPLTFFLGLPYAKVSPLMLVGLLPLLRIYKISRNRNFDKLNVLVFVFFSYHFLNLGLSYLSLRQQYSFDNLLFNDTILSYSLHGSIPILIFFLIQRLNFDQLLITKRFIYILYSLFGIIIIFSIFLVANFLGLALSVDQIRDLPILLYRLSNFEEGQIGLESLYMYFGRSNTIAPALSLLLSSLIPILRCKLINFFKARNLFIALIIIINIVVIYLLYSRAALIGILLPFIIFEIFTILKFRQLFINFTFQIYSFLFALSVFAITIFNDQRFSFDAYAKDGRAAILKGLINLPETFRFFGNGVGSNYYLCSLRPFSYGNRYETDFCTLHNFYATLMHDYGLLGFLLFILIIFIFSLKIISAVNIYKKNCKNKYLSYENFPLPIIQSIYFLISASILLFFDSDIMTQHTIFSILFWSLLAINYKSLNLYILYKKK